MSTKPPSRPCWWRWPKHSNSRLLDLHVSIRFLITATDTDAGKTVFAAALTLALEGIYFKPVQAGLEDVDSDTVRRLTGLPAEHFLPELYRLRTQASPHFAAE